MRHLQEDLTGLPVVCLLHAAHINQLARLVEHEVAQLRFNVALTIALQRPLVLAAEGSPAEGVTVESVALSLATSQGVSCR